MNDDTDDQETPETYKDHEEGGDEALLVRICVLGSDVLLNSVLRAFVETVGSKPETVAAAFRFYLVPVSGLTSIPSFGNGMHPARQTNANHSGFGRGLLPGEVILFMLTFTWLHWALPPKSRSCFP